MMNVVQLSNKVTTSFIQESSVGGGRQCPEIEERGGDRIVYTVINQLDYEAKSFYGVQGGKNITLKV